MFNRDWGRPVTAEGRADRVNAKEVIRQAGTSGHAELPGHAAQQIRRLVRRRQILIGVPVAAWGVRRCGRPYLSVEEVCL